MTGIVMLTLQLSIAIGSFVGASKVIEWYHKGKKGGMNNESSNHKSRLH